MVMNLIDSVTLEESEEFFPDLEENESEVKNWYMWCEKNQEEAFVGWKHSGSFVSTSQLVVKVFETAPT